MFRRTAVALGALTLAALITLSAATVASAQSYANVVVQPGDTLSKIAARFCTTWQEIYRINQSTIGPNPRVIEVGMPLTVPNGCGFEGGGGGAAPSTDSGPRVHATGTYRAPFYDVAWGDTLYSIALRFGTSVQALRAANGLTDDVIGPGWVLEIGSGSGGGGAVAPQPPVAGSGLERIRFNPGAIAASRSGAIVAAQPARYILGAAAGQAIEVWTYSHGEPLQVTVTTAGGQPVTLGGTNGDLSNYLFGALPANGDYIVTVAPAYPPESPTLNFDMTVGIR